MFHIHLFGEFCIEDDQGQPLKLGIRKAQLLLAHLLLHPGQLRPRERLVDLFWPDAEEAKAERSLNQTIYVLRNLLEPKGTPKGAYLITKQRAVQFNSDSDVWVDIHKFESLLKKSDQATDQEQIELLNQATALYQGDLLEGSYDDWCLEARESFRTLYINGLKTLIDHHAAQNEFDVAIDYAKQSLSKDPFQEETHRQLMYLHSASGDRAAALRQYQELEQMLQDELEVEPLPETIALYEEIKGRSATSKLDELVQQIQPLQTQALGSIFVNRTEELTQFAQAWTSMTSGQGQAIWISGEAGVGKSRLVQECLDYAKRQQAITIKGRCYEMEGALPYQPLIEAIRNSLSRLPEEVLSQVPERAVCELLKLVPEFEQTFPALNPSTILEAPEQERSRLFQAVVQFFSVISTHQPLILFLDDLQWVDDSTLQFAHYLTRNLSGLPMLFLAVYRDVEVNEDHPLYPTLQHLTRDHLIHHWQLQPLNVEDTSSLVEGLLNTDQLQTFSQSIYSESKGLPFFTEELVKSLIEAGTLTQDEQGRWQSNTDQIPETAVPSSIRALVGTRLRRLNRTSRQVLEIASTVGKSFTFDLMLQTMGPWQVELMKPIEELLWARFLYEENGRYQFNHDLVRQVIYGDLPPERCRQFHLRLGETLEEIYEDDPRNVSILGDIAQHFHKASKTKKALEYALKAGQQIWHKTYAKDEALHLYLRAVELAESLEAKDKLMLAYKGLGEIYATTDEYEKGLEYSTKALDLSDSDEERTDIYCTIARVYHYQQNIEQALAYCQKALDELGDASDSLQAAKAYGYASSFLNWLSRFDESIDYCEKALGILEKHPNENLKVLVLSQLGHAHSGSGNDEQALDYLTEAAKLSRKIGDPESMIQSYFRLALAHFNNHNLDEAVDAWTSALKTLQNIGNRHGDEAIMYNWLTMALMRKRDFEQALGHAGKYLEKSMIVEKTESTASAFGILGCLYDALDMPEKSDEAFEKASQLSPKNGKVHQGMIIAYLCMDMAEKASDSLASCKDFLEAHQIQYLNTCPAYTPAFEIFRKNKLFKELVAKQ